MREASFKATWKSVCEEHGKENRTFRETEGPQAAGRGNAKA